MPNLLKNVLPQTPYEGISEDAKDHVLRHFWQLTLAQFVTKLADTLASAKIVLPWLLSSVGAPSSLAGMLTPIRESGSLLPQIIIGGWVQQFDQRRFLYAIGAGLQGLFLLGMLVALLTQSGLIAGLWVVFLLALFSLARALCSITSKDVVGKVIPKGSRGRLTGLSASLAGLIGIAFGVLLYLGQRENLESKWMLLGTASALWFLAALCFVAIREPSGETRSAPKFSERLGEAWQLLITDRVFMQFVITRSLMMSSSLAAPYFVLLAQGHAAEQSLAGLGLFIVISGIAGFVSGPVWGAAADRSSRRVLLFTSLLTGITCLLAAALALVADQEQSQPLVFWSALALFFCLSLIHQGVRLGRKTYVIDIASGNRQTDYVSVSNTAIGVLLLLVGTLGAVGSQFSTVGVLVFFAVMSLLALITGRQLPEAS